MKHFTNHVGRAACQAGFVFIQRNLIAAAALLVAAQLHAQTRYDATLPGSGTKCVIEGTSSIHDWKMEGVIVTGFFELGAGAKLDGPDGKVDAKAGISIPVRSLKSSSPKMDEVYKQHMEETKFKKIGYALKELTKKGAEFTSKGDLTVHGETKAIEMPVKIVKVDDKKLKISGKTALKMSDYKVKPPNPTIPGIGSITTGDDITITFDWVVETK